MKFKISNAKFSCVFVRKFVINNEGQNSKYFDKTMQLYMNKVQSWVVKNSLKFYHL